MFVYGIVPPIQIFLMPLLVVLALTTATGIGLWLSALNVRYRDVHHAIPFLILLGLFVSPITYPFHLVPAVRPADLRDQSAGRRARDLPVDAVSDRGWPGAIVLIPIAASLAAARHRRGLLPARRAARSPTSSERPRMSEPAISIEGVGKRYQLGRRPATATCSSERLQRVAAAPLRGIAGTARERRASHLTPRTTRSRETLWALRDVSLEIGARRGGRRSSGGTAPARARC